MMIVGLLSVPPGHWKHGGTVFTCKRGRVLRLQGLKSAVAGVQGRYRYRWACVKAKLAARNCCPDLDVQRDLRSLRCGIIVKQP
jgi:hypothetical protein